MVRHVQIEGSGKRWWWRARKLSWVWGWIPYMRTMGSGYADSMESAAEEARDSLNGGNA